MLLNMVLLNSLALCQRQAKYHQVVILIKCIVLSKRHSKLKKLSIAAKKTQLSIHNKCGKLRIIKVDLFHCQDLIQLGVADLTQNKAQLTPRLEELYMQLVKTHLIKMIVVVMIIDQCQ